ncbi:hypothetical protein KC660_02490, partial [Candidatus Dojkabacteria bacterium]|nr:hypothetical protein [Candidatus Dojkabacteria bacterium]
VLTIDNELIGTGQNKINEKESFLNHAEMRIIIDYSSELFKVKKANPSVVIRLYSTWEPCIQCFGASVINQINEIYYILDDPNGGASKVKKEGLGKVYETMWPRIEKIAHSNRPLELLIAYFRAEIKKGNVDKPTKILKLYGYDE